MIGKDSYKRRTKALGAWVISIDLGQFRGKYIYTQELSYVKPGQAHGPTV